MKGASVADFLRRFAGWLAPVVLIGIVVLALRGPVAVWLRGAELFDEEAMREWIREARIESANLPQLAQTYLDMARREDELRAAVSQSTGLARLRIENELRAHEQRLEIKREEIQEFLKALGNPPTRLYRGQLPLFPLVYRLTLRFEPAYRLTPIRWDSELPREARQSRELHEPIADGATAAVEYHLHAYHQVQAKERQEAARRLAVGGIGLAAALAGVLWFVIHQRRRREQDRQRLVAEQQANQAERRRLEEELRRQEAERRHEEAQMQNLELRSQLFANIGIMAGSYAHNIKNLLVRPNDLLRRCLDEHPAGDDQRHMLREVKETLGTVTERLQQILQTVRRDPSQAEATPIDLVQVASEMHRAWGDLAASKWKMSLRLDVPAEPLIIQGDRSHLQQAIENLVFNARDATFEMRNHLRETARAGGASEAEKRQALLAAASWRGEATLRLRRRDGAIVLEVSDNGIGMTDDVRENCLKTHFSTKRNNALFAGLSAGMGLGLSFVSAILTHHRARLEIESRPLHGATFRVVFPAMTASPAP